MIALSLEKSIAPLITALTLAEMVAFAVKFHAQSRRVTNEIGNVALERDLPAETKTIDPMCANVSPQERFSPGHLRAKLFGALPLP